MVARHTKKREKTTTMVGLTPPEVLEGFFEGMA